MRMQNKGFKGKSCMDRRCIACESSPPNLSPSIIKNLGATFCNVDPEQLTEEALSKKKKVSALGGKKPVFKKKSKDDDDRVPKKKSRK